MPTRWQPRPTPLESERFSLAYSGRLAEGLLHLKSWLGPARRSLLRSRRPSPALDGLLADYVQFCHDGGTHFGIPKHAILAVQHHFSLPKKVHQSLDVLVVVASQTPRSTPHPFALERYSAYGSETRWSRLKQQVPQPFA